jgi:putative transposase
MVIARLSSATTFSSLYQTGHGICLQGDGCVPETGNHSGKPAHFAPSHLDRDFEAHKPNERWVNDVTYIRTHERFLYQAIVLDLVFRQIIGWSIKMRMSADLVIVALLIASLRRRPKQEILIQAD